MFRVKKAAPHIGPVRASHTTCLKRWLNRIHLGDCRNLLTKLPDACVDALITDAPYGMGAGSWDVLDRELIESVIHEGMRIMKPNSSFYWFGRPERIAEFWSLFKPLHPRWLTWYYRNSSNINHLTFGWNSQVIVYGIKGNPVFNLDAGRIPYSKNTCTKRIHHDDSTSQYGLKPNNKPGKVYHERGRKPMDVLEFPAVTAGVAKAEGRWHPVQKPLNLMRYLIGISTNPGDIILDPFCGGGTTCLAARQMHRNFIGMEYAPEFVQSARRRLSIHS